MPPVLPKARRELIEWVRSRLGPWAEDPATIGLDAEDLARLADAFDEAEAASEDQRLAQQRARAATHEFNEREQSLRTVAAALVRTIKAHAAMTDDPSIYPDAQIPADRPKTPLGPPGTPFNLRFELTTTGTIRLAWDADDASRSSGAYFVIRRRLAGETADRTIGDASQRTFEDRTLPAGTPTATYTIATRRGEYEQISATLAVQFGTLAASPAAVRLAS